MLVEPAGPLNIGSVARLCANFGVSELRLVAPRCDHLSEEAMLMAVHGQALLQAAVVVPDLLTAINDCRRTVGSLGVCTGACSASGRRRRLRRWRGRRAAPPAAARMGGVAGRTRTRVLEEACWTRT